ncbi:MAG TPA: hypothetical protein VFH51_08095, partial [Myxococcota bacterium]|nr:hypothetical protein [Myxococcota bacterium]
MILRKLSVRSAAAAATEMPQPRLVTASGANPATAAQTRRVQLSFAPPQDGWHGPLAGLQRSVSVPTERRPKEASKHRRTHSEPLPDTQPSRWGALRPPKGLGIGLGALKPPSLAAVLGCSHCTSRAPTPPLEVSGFIPQPSWTATEEGRRRHLAAFNLEGVSRSYGEARDSLMQEVLRELDRLHGAPVATPPVRRAAPMRSPDDMARRQLEIILKVGCSGAGLLRSLRGFVDQAEIQHPAEALDRLTRINNTLSDALRLSEPGNALHDVYVRLL